MNNPYSTPPTNKKEYISHIGKILIEKNGKKDFYTPEEVNAAHRSTPWFDLLDLSSWAMSIFSSHSDFDEYHKSIGAICDYIEMKTEMLRGLSISSATGWMEIPDVDIDASWLDFGDIFEGFFEGIGAFVEAIFDGL